MSMCVSPFLRATPRSHQPPDSLPYPAPNHLQVYRPVPIMTLDADKHMYRENALYADHVRRFENAIEQYQHQANGAHPAAEHAAARIPPQKRWPYALNAPKYCCLFAWFSRKHACFLDRHCLQTFWMPAMSSS